MPTTKILSEEIIFKAKYFWIKQFVMETNGETFTKEFIERWPIVVVIAIDDNDEIYLVSQYREVWKTQTLELPAGNCENNADPLETAKRELHEETGVTARNWKHLTTLMHAANIRQEAHIFLATSLTEGKPHPDEEETNQRVIKMPFADAVKKALNSEMNVAGSLAALLLFDTMRREGEI